MTERSSSLTDTADEATRPVPTARSWISRARRWGPLAVLVVMLIVFSLVNPRFLSIGNFQSLLSQLAIPLVLAAGLTFVILMGSIDLSAEGVMAATSLIVSILIANSVNSLNLGVIAVLVALAAGAAFGLISGVVHTRLRLPSLMVTLGIWFVGLGVANILFPGTQPRISDLGFRSWALDTWWGVNRLVYVAVAVLILSFVVLRWTRFGRTIYGIGGGEELMILSGIRVARYRIGAFVVSAGLAGLAGLMATAQIGAGSVDAGTGQLFPAISAAVIGGTLLSGGQGGVLQSALGVVILTVLKDGLVLSGVGPYAQQAVVGVVIIVVVVAAAWSSRSRLKVVK